MCVVITPALVIHQIAKRFSECAMQISVGMSRQDIVRCSGVAKGIDISDIHDFRRIAGIRRRAKINFSADDRIRHRLACAGTWILAVDGMGGIKAENSYG